MRLKWLLLGVLVITPYCYAASYSYQQQSGIGEIASNLFTDAMAIRQLIRVVCIVTGACFIMGSLLQYKKHRDNPTEVRLSMPIFTLLTGLVLIGLAFIPFQG